MPIKLHFSRVWPGKCACYNCERRHENCHKECAEYAAEVMMDIIGSGEVASKRQLALDMYNIEHQRYKRGLKI